MNVTSHPTADWALQQFREVLTEEKPYRFPIHDRDNIYSSELDSALKSMGLSILKTPFRSPQANAFCERLGGSMRRECLDFLIPLNDRHLRAILKEWGAHTTEAAPTPAWGRAFPNPQEAYRRRKFQVTVFRVVGIPVLGGLHHEYRLEKLGA